MSALSRALPRPLVRGVKSDAARNGATLAFLALLALWVTIYAPQYSVVTSLAAAVMLGVATWMFFSENYALTMAVLLLYLGIADGYLKLKTGSSFATLGRDVLLYAIALGALARVVIRRERLHTPPLGGWIAAFVVVCLVQVANPESYPVGHGLSALRPHLEFVPLFFLGYMVMRSRHRLRIFLLLLLVCGAANGVVSLIQSNLSPEQLAGWGPGYRDRIEGVGVSGRTFYAEGENHVRPFGLGSDSGVGGVWGMLALPAGLALLTLARRRKLHALLAGCLSAGAVLAVVTSQGRASVVAAFVAVMAFFVLSVSLKRIVPTVVALLTGALVALTVISMVSGDGGAFSRYESITPTRVLSTAHDERGRSLELAIKYLGDYPLGAGLGVVGPAAGFAGGERKSVSGETAFSFLVAELGIAGLVIFMSFALRLLWVASRRTRAAPDHETRVLLAGICAPLFGIAATYFSAAATAVSPSSPYLWFVAGTFAWWLTVDATGRGKVRWGAPAVASGPAQAPLAAPAPTPLPARTPTPAFHSPVLPRVAAPQDRPPAPPAPAPAAATAPAPAVVPTARRLVTLIYRGRGSRIDGIRAYTEQLADALAAHDGVDAQTEFHGAVEKALQGSSAAVIQYNPFSYGRYGFAPWLPRVLGRARSVEGRPILAVTVHEAFVRGTSPRAAAIGFWQRRQLRAILCNVDVAFTATEELEKLVRSLGPRCPVHHVPVGSNIPDGRDRRAAERRALGLRPGELVVAAFGTGHPSQLTSYLVSAANAIAADHPEVVFLNLGAGVRRLDGLAANVRLIQPGELDPDELAAKLSAADLFLAPFADGVSTRRTTLMAALQHALPVVGTESRHTDSLLRRNRDALRLVPAGARQTFVTAAREVATDQAARHRLSANARRLYDEHFHWERISTRIVERLDDAARGS